MSTGPAPSAAALREIREVLAELAAAGIQLSGLPPQRPVPRRAEPLLAQRLTRARTVGARRAIVQTLGSPSLRGTEAVSVLAAIARQDPRILDAALASLARVAGPDDVEVLLDFYAKRSLGARRAALSPGLARIGSRASIRALTTSLSDPALVLPALAALRRYKPSGALTAVRALRGHAKAEIARAATLTAEALESARVAAAGRRASASPSVAQPTTSSPAASSATESAVPSSHLGIAEGIWLYACRSFTTPARSSASCGTLMLTLSLMPLWSGRGPLLPLAVMAVLLYAVGLALYLRSKEQQRHVPR